jgi:hypothetical protein
MSAKFAGSPGSAQVYYSRSTMGAERFQLTGTWTGESYGEDALVKAKKNIFGAKRVRGANEASEQGDRY